MWADLSQLTTKWPKGSSHRIKKNIQLPSTIVWSLFDTLILGQSCNTVIATQVSRVRHLNRWLTGRIQVRNSPGQYQRSHSTGILILLVFSVSTALCTTIGKAWGEYDVGRKQECSKRMCLIREKYLIFSKYYNYPTFSPLIYLYLNSPNCNNGMV